MAVTASRYCWAPMRGATSPTGAAEACGAESVAFGAVGVHWHGRRVDAENVEA